VLAFWLSLLCCPFFTAVLVRWLGGSFAKLGFSVGLCGFANVPANEMAYSFDVVNYKICTFRNKVN
jgi:hypothetical protein